MWYFAYGIDLNWDAVGEWCQDNGRVTPWRETPKPAVLENYRLCFPAYDPYWRGGVADVIPEPGKTVKGVLFRVRPAVMNVLDEMFGRSQDTWGRENGVRRRYRVTVRSYASPQPVGATIFRFQRTSWQHVPPTERYMHRIAGAAASLHLSTMWVMYLRSFPMMASAGERAATVLGA